MAKAVTSTVLAIAQQRGTISFRDKVRIQTARGGTTVSLGDLVNMRAGLAQAVCYRGITGDADTDCGPAFDEDFGVALTGGRGRYSYSNMGPQLAADALVRRRKSSFETIARKLLFVPSGMRDATFNHRRHAAFKAIDVDQSGHPYSDDFDIMPADGAGFEASAEDLVRFGQLHLTGQTTNGRQILSRYTLRLLHSAPNGGFYGYGWGRIGGGNSTAVLISDGQVNGGQAMLLLNTRRQVGALVISNAAHDEVSELALKAIETVVPGTAAMFDVAVKKEQAKHDAKVSQFLPPGTFAGVGSLRVRGRRSPIRLSVDHNRLSWMIVDDRGEQSQSETDGGFRGWEVACPVRISACRRPGAKAKLWLSRDGDGLSGQLQVTSFNGQLPFPVRIELH